MSTKMTFDDFIFEDDVSLLQLSDSFFPTGLYANSNGLELLFYNKNKIDL